MFDSGLGSVVVLALVVPIAVIGVIALAITAIAGGRDPDPTGARQRAVYLGAVSFVTLFLMLFSAFAVVGSLTDLLHDHTNSVSFSSSATLSSGSGSSDNPFTVDESPQVTTTEKDVDHATEHAVSGAVGAALLFAAAAALFWWHRQRLQAIIDEPFFVTSPARRAVQAYFLSVSFVAALVALGAAASALYGVYRVVLPDFSGPTTDDEARRGLGQFLSSAALAAGAVYLFITHVFKPEEWERQATGGLDTGVGPVI
jgi:hypothetical protein